MARLSFRTRLLVGHFLPILILVPVAGLALIYLLETRLILPILANEMINQGMLVERLTNRQPDLWHSSMQAQALIDSLDIRRPSRIGLLTPGHVLLATSRSEDLSLIGKTIPNLPDTSTLTEPWWAMTSGDLSNEQILDVLITVRQANGEVIGLIRIYRRTTDIQQTLTNMRLLILGVLLVGLLLSGVIAYYLSESVSRQLKIFSETIADSPLEGPAEVLPENGSGDYSGLAHSYNRLQVRREELEQTRQEILAGVIHEMGRPLGSLRTALYALQVGAVNDPILRADLMKGMSERIDRMGRLLEDMALTYRGLEPQEIHLKPVQVREWLEALMPLWAESARKRSITWEATLSPDAGSIKTDPDRLAQSLSNLVDNAIKFTPAGGRVSLQMLATGHEISFQISDTGMGIRPEVQRHLFAPFFRGVQPSWKAPGLGLGLSIAKSITESLGGKISVQSVPCQGSVFTITLPRLGKNSSPVLSDRNIH